MFAKRLSWVAALCLALTALLPSSGSALTLAELTGTAATSSYSPITITSASNKTITITATPLSFDGSAWTYQVAWNRAKNAKGSLYVSLKSNAGIKVASVAAADQAGTVAFTALPGTVFRVEFYSLPNGKGSLLVRKYFTSLSADKAVATTGAASNSPYLMGTNGYTFANTGTSSTYGVGTSGYTAVGTATSPALAVTNGNTVYWPVSTLQKDPSPTSANNPYCKSSNGQSCYAIPAALDPVQNYDLSLKHSTPEQSSQWVVAYNYRSATTGKCMHYDAAGTRSEIPCYADHPLPTVSDSYVPTFNDPTFRFDLANATCVYTGAYSAYKDWGHSHWDFCTGYGGTAWAGAVPYTVVDSNNPVSGNPTITTTTTTTTNPNPALTTVNPTTTVIGNVEYKTVGQILQEKYGINWDPTNKPKDPQPSGINNYYSSTYLAPLPSQSVGLNYVNANKGASVQMVLGMNYTDGKGNCYHVDFSTGQKVVSHLDCYADRPLPVITGDVPAPTNDNSNFPWSLANATCIYIAGNSPYKNPGASHYNSCGGTDPANIPGPSTTVDVNEKVAIKYNGVSIDTDPYNPKNPYAPRVDNYSYAMPTIDTGLKLVDANGGMSVLWVQSFLYKDASGACHKMDSTSGTPVVSDIPCYANHPLPTWTKSTPPAQNDPTFDWTMSNAQCLYTAGRGKPIPGASELLSCGVAGVNRDPGYFQNPIYPVNPDVKLPSSTDPSIVTSVTYRQVSGTTSGAVICYKTQRVKGANSLYPNEYTMVTTTVTCPDPLPPVLVVGQVPSANDTNFNWAAANATCVRKADNSPVPCGTSAASTGINGQCGSVSGQIYTSLSSSASGLCTVGTMSGFSGTGPWSWSCSGNNGGIAATCSAYANSSQQQAGQQTLYAKQTACQTSGGTWVASTSVCVPPSSTTTNQPAINEPSSGSVGQKATINTPNTGGVGAFLNMSSSNPSVCSVPSTVYVKPNDPLSTPSCTCTGKGTTTVTISGAGFQTSTETITCN